MRALIDDILDVAKIETGSSRSSARPWTSSRRSATPPVSGATGRGKRLGFDIDLPDAPSWVMGDAARLRQMVFNLLSNAVKFTPAGGISLALALDAGHLRLTVADTGIGIPAEAHELIFESFRQADAGTTRQFGGTGLGLSICEYSRAAWGATCRWSAQLGEGATFTLDVPLDPAETPDVAVEPGRAADRRAQSDHAGDAQGAVRRFRPIAFAGDAAEALGMARPRHRSVSSPTCPRSAMRRTRRWRRWDNARRLRCSCRPGRGPARSARRRDGAAFAAKLIEAMDGLCPVLVPRAA
ncbi:sensor histidine kinase [Sphingomonas sp. MMS24-JH45]